MTTKSSPSPFEYAEEVYPNLSDKIISRRTQEVKEAERLIRFLLRRFCLVEKGSQPRWISPKDAVPEIRERVLICEKVANQHKVFIGKRVPSPCTDGWDWNQSKKESVVAWMPLPKYSTEIAKEVEG